MRTIGRSKAVGEVPVALVLPRHGHDRAGAVVGQHVVGGVDRDLRAVDRVGRVDAQEHAGLGPVGGQPVDLGGLADLVQVGLVRRPLLVGDQLRGQRGVGRDHHERRAEQRVGAGRVDRQRLVRPGDRESTCAPSERPIQLRCAVIRGPARSAPARPGRPAAPGRSR